MSLANQTYLTMNSKYKIPQYGLGVYQIQGDEATEKACLTAFEIGIRHIDTAHAYQNERGVGAAVSKCKIPREQLFITSSLLNYGFLTMVKVLLQKQSIKCSED